MEAPQPLAPGISPEDRLLAALGRAHERLRLRACMDPIWHANGALVAAVQLVGSSLVVAHAGTVRVLLWRSGELRALTEDHSLLNRFIREVGPTPEEVRSFPHPDVFESCLGMGDPRIDARTEPIRGGDLVLVCSHGLIRGVTENAINEIVSRAPEDLDGLANALVAISASPHAAVIAIRMASRSRESTAR
jgi:protein phosphatase